MTEKKQKKEKVNIATRQPQKPKPGIFANLGKDRQQNVKHPFSEIVNFPAEQSAEETKLEAASIEISGITGISGIAAHTGHYSASPVFDYAKTPDFLTRSILEKGLFRGKSKQIYDYLWSVSRGTLQPIRTFRKTHNEIKQGAGVGSRNTILDGLRHLERIGLIKIVSSVGVTSGNEYEIFTLDELGYTDLNGITGITSAKKAAQSAGAAASIDIPDIAAIPVVQDMSDIPISNLSGVSEDIENKDNYDDDANIFLKDVEYIDEDSAIISAFEKLNEAARAATGQDLTRKDWQAFAELIELVLHEAAIANPRHKNISSFMSFAVENLRRRLRAEGKPTRAAINKPV